MGKRINSMKYTILASVMLAFLIAALTSCSPGVGFDWYTSDAEKQQKKEDK